MSRSLPPSKRSIANSLPPPYPVPIAMKKMQDIPEVKYPAAMAGQDRANFLRGNSGGIDRTIK